MSPSSNASRRTVIAPAVVETLVTVAARGVPGVHALGSPSGGGGAGALGAVRGALPGASDGGVQVELGEVQAAVDLRLVAEYGVPLRRLAEDVRERVVADVEGMGGFEVTEVNVAVVDVHLTDEEQS